MIISRTCRLKCKLGVKLLSEFRKKTVCSRNVAYPLKPKLFDHPVLKYPVLPLYSALCLGRMGRDDLNPKLIACLPKCGQRLLPGKFLFNGRISFRDVHILLVSIQSLWHPISVYP